MDFLSMLQGGMNPQQKQYSQVQGRENPGAIPLQNSGRGGKGYTANLQPTKNPQAQQLQMAPAQQPPQAQYPRYNPQTGYNSPAPGRESFMHQRPQGYPMNFRDAPQLPVHDPELYDEVLRSGQYGVQRPGQDPMAILRSLLGL